MTNSHEVYVDGKQTKDFLSLQQMKVVNKDEYANGALEKLLYIGESSEDKCADRITYSEITTTLCYAWIRKFSGNFGSKARKNCDNKLIYIYFARIFI